jgi:hypothetical protein
MRIVGAQLGRPAVIQELHGGTRALLLTDERHLGGENMIGLGKVRERSSEVASSTVAVQ